MKLGLVDSFIERCLEAGYQKEEEKNRIHQDVLNRFVSIRYKSVRFLLVWVGYYRQALTAE